VQNILEEKFGAIECESGNAEVQWKNIKECVLDTISDLVGKVQKRTRKTWITQEMTSNTNELRELKNVNIGEGTRNYRKLRNELKRTTEKTKNEYLENAYTEIMDFHRTGRYDSIYMRTKVLGWEGDPGDSKYWYRRLSGE
jgi:type I site-specific restriction-modification system R (restriction) subunit